MIIFNALQTSLNGGIGRYSYELARNLYLKGNSEVKLVIREQDIDMFKFAKYEDLIIAKGINNSTERNIYEQFKLPRIIYKRYPNALIHYPDTMAPLLCKNKVVITVHDLAFKSLKGVFTFKSKLWKNIITDMSIKKADKIIAITEFTKREILNNYPKVDNSKIHVIYNGFNDFSKDRISIENIRPEIKKMEKDYILTVSTISPRKNIQILIRAFNEIKERTNKNMIIAGGDGWLSNNIYELVEKLSLSNRIIFTGRINDDELKYLYRNSSLFVYPSFYEGFGLPPMEALSFKVPCILSDIDVFKEVYGEEVSYFSVDSYIDLSEKIIMNNYIRSNMNFSEKYNWDKCANEVWKVYNGKIM